MAKLKIGKTEITTFPLPPAGFNPLTASAKDLATYGLPNIPEMAKNPAYADMLKKMFSRPGGMKFITPELKETNTYHGPVQKLDADTGTSNNWSGYVLTSSPGTYTSCGGTFTVPDVYPVSGGSEPQVCVVWYGIDGDGSSDVLQGGTSTDTSGNCYVWIEWYPTSEVLVTNFPVKPGDVMWVFIWPLSATTANILYVNYTSVISATVGISAPSGTTLSGNCAEGIVERPSISGSVVTLPSYGEVYFDNAMAGQANGSNVPLSSGTALTMVDSNTGQTLSIPVDIATNTFKTEYSGPM